MIPGRLFTKVPLIPLFLALTCPAVSMLPAQISFSPGGVVVHRKGAVTITEAQALRVGKIVDNPGMATHRRTPSRIWIPREIRDRQVAFFESMYLQSLSNKIDPTTLQIGTLLGGSHGLSSVLALLENPYIQDILELDPKEKDAVQAVAATFRDRIAKEITQFARNNPNATPEEHGMTLLGAAERLSPGLREMLGQALDAETIETTKEIVFLLYGGLESPVVDMEILEIFALSKEQRDKLEEIAVDANDKRASLLAGKELAKLNERDFERISTRLGEIGKLNARKIDELFDERQREWVADLYVKKDKLAAELKKTAKGR